MNPSGVHTSVIASQNLSPGQPDENARTVGKSPTATGSLASFAPSCVDGNPALQRRALEQGGANTFQFIELRRGSGGRTVLDFAPSASPFFRGARGDA